MDLKFVFPHIKTVEERNEAIELIEEMLENNFKRDQSPLPDKPFSKKISDIIYAEIKNQGFMENREQIEKFLEKLLEEVKSLPEIRISIAIPPTEKLKSNLKNWAIENGQEKAIFNIEIKSEIVAGAIIMSSHGEYSNFSLANQIDNYFKEKQQEVLSLL